MKLWVSHRIFTAAVIFFTLDLIAKQILCIDILHYKLEAIKKQFVKSIEDDIIQSPNDKRLYRALELTNGMKVILVKDDSSTQSAVSLIVNAGTMNDPKHLPGVAHFLEHLLITQGTKKYQEESSFLKFLPSHGGADYARTSLDITEYSFAVLHEFLAEALDRFSQLFIAPQFTSDLVDREINAINSEFERGLQNDNKRWFQILRSHANNSHDYYTSLVGSKQVLLDNVNINNSTLLAETVKFFDEFYSSNLMTLAVINNGSLDEMLFLIAPLFGVVPNKNLKVPYWPTHPYGQQQLGYYYEIEPIEDYHMFVMLFPSANYESHFKSKPWAYTFHSLNHKGKDSLHDMLQRIGMTNSIAVSRSVDAKGIGFISISGILTSQGVRRIDEVLEIIMKNVNALKKQPMRRWVHEEIEQINKINYRFLTISSGMNYASELADALHKVPAKYATYKDYIMDEYEPELIKKFLDHIDADNMNIYIWSKTFIGKTDRQEKWYGSKYRMDKIGENLIKNLKSQETSKDDAIFKFPKPNSYLPSNFDILQHDDVDINVTENEVPKLRGISQKLPKNSKHLKNVAKFFSNVPKLIQETNQTRIWYLRDTNFRRPKVFLYFLLRSPKVMQSPETVGLANLLKFLINHDIPLKTEGAPMAGLQVQIYVMENPSGYRITFSGYHQKMSPFVVEIFHSMASSEFSKKNFNIQKQMLTQVYRTEETQKPYKLCDSYRRLLLKSKSWSVMELLTGVKDLTLQDVVKFRREFFTKLHIKMFAYGNIKQSGTIKIMNDVSEIIQKSYKTRPLFVGELERMRTVELSPRQPCLYVAETNLHPESAISVIFQTGGYSIKTEAVNSLLGRIMRELCFEQLRTKEQLGYRAHCYFYTMNGINNVEFLVQGDKSPDYIESRIEALIVKLEKIISNMSLVELETYKDSYIKLLLEKDQSMSQMAWNVWNKIENELYFFNRAEVLANAVKNVTKNELLSYYKENLNVNSSKRRKLSIYVISTRNSTLAEKMKSINTSNMTMISVAAFKNSMGLYGIPKVHMDVKPIGVDP